MSRLAATDPWLAFREPRPGAEVRLFCFPHAGGGASLFRGWADALPPAVEVCPVLALRLAPTARATMPAAPAADPFGTRRNSAFVVGWIEGAKSELRAQLSDATFCPPGKTR